MQSFTQRTLVVGICGGMRSDSSTRRALRLALSGAAEMGAATLLLELERLALPWCDSRFQDDFAVKQLRHMVDGASGLLLASPEYHSSLSGVLKNALDWLLPEQVAGKPVGLIGVAGGALGAPGALLAMREVARSLHAWVVPEQVSVARSREAFDSTGRLHEVALEQRLLRVGRTVAGFARAFPGMDFSHSEVFLELQPSPAPSGRGIGV